MLAGLDTQYWRNVTVTARSATVSVAQNNPSEAADPKRSDLIIELPRAIQSRHPPTNLAEGVGWFVESIVFARLWLISRC